MLSLGVGVLGGRYTHAVIKADLAGETQAAAAAAFTMALGELFSFSIEDSTTLCVFSTVNGSYDNKDLGSNLNLLSTGLSSLFVVLLLVFGAGSEVLDEVRKGEFCEDAAINVPLYFVGPALLVGLVAYFGVVAVALFQDTGRSDFFFRRPAGCARW